MKEPAIKTLIITLLYIHLWTQIKTLLDTDRADR